MMFVVIIALSACMLATSAAAQSYNPVVIGQQWSYRNGVGVSQTAIFTTDETLPNGTTAARRENEAIAGFDVERFWNYWTEDVLGRSFLHGFWRPDENFGILYDPPILWTEVDLRVGKAWQTPTDATTFDGVDTGALIALFEVMLEQTWSGPAGDFDTYCVYQGQPEPQPKISNQSHQYSLTGRRLDGPGKQVFSFVECVALDVGTIAQGGPDEPLNRWQQLQEFLPPVSTQNSSWGQLKASFQK